jgi:energy-coupling factor transporter ATP-binding protein EcfA2
MHVIDLVLQGVRRFGESRKFPVKPGFNVVFGPAETGKTTLAECLFDLLYPDRYQEGEGSFLSRGDPAASRAGLTLAAGRDIFRILKDYKTQRISFTQYNPASQKFEPLAADAAQAASLLSSTLELPPFDVYYYLFAGAADRMPSALGAAGPATPSGPGMAPGTISAGGLLPPGMMSVPGMMPMPGMMPAPGMMAMPGMMPGMPMAPGMAAMMPGMVPGMMPGMMPMAPGQPGMAMPDDGMTPTEREDKLVQLRQELKDAEKVGEIQYEIDGLQQKVFEIDHKKTQTSQFDKWLEEAKEQLDRYPTFRRLPENIDERLDRYKDLEAVQAKEVEKFDGAALEFDEEFRNLAHTPKLWDQQLFRIGAGALVGGLLVFILAQVAGFDSLKYLGLLSIPGVFVTAYVVWKHIEGMTRTSFLEGKLADLEEKKGAVLKRFEVETAVINKLMAGSDSETVEELKQKLEKWRALDENFRSRMERKKKLIKELDLDRLDREGKELKAKVAGLEEALRKYAAFSMDPGEMRKEVKRLEDIVRRQSPQSQALRGTEGLGVPDFDKPAGPAPGATMNAESSPGTSGFRRRRAPIASAPQAYDQLLQVAARLFENEREKLIAHIQPRLNLYVQALFAKRYTEVRIDPDGSMALRAAEGGRWQDFDRLSPAARDTLYLALQITLLEQAAQKHSLPIILDNPLARMDETAAMLAVKALKRLSERTQVILLTAQKAPIPLADHSLSLT